MLISSSLLILLADFRLPLEMDVTAFLMLPLIAFTVCRGPKLGLGAAWGLAVLKEAVDRMRWGSVVPWIVTPVNIAIWGLVASALVLLVAAALEAQRLREAELQLRTLRQTMVTVQDIVRNRLQFVLLVCDLLDNGTLPPPYYVERVRAGIGEMLMRLDQLSQLPHVRVEEAAPGIEVVRITERDIQEVPPERL